MVEPSKIPPGKSPEMVIITREEYEKFLANDAKVAYLQSLPIPRGNAGAGILAHLIISKFVDHLPFYRQVQMFKRQGVTLAESTVNDWFRSGYDLLEPLYEYLKKKILQGNYLIADETPISVLNKDKPGATHKGYHWVYYSPVERLVLFDYRRGRGRATGLRPAESAPTGKIRLDPARTSYMAERKHHTGIA